MKIQYASLNLSVKEVNKELSQIRAVFSTGDEDRHGEIIDQKGWKLGEFMLNPVVLWSHDDKQPAIGKVVDISFVDGNLEGTIQFAADIYDFAKLIYDLYVGEYIRAISVGFINDKWMYDEEKQLVVLLENTLLEASCVNIPANALALAKSKGVNVEPMEKRLKAANKMNNKFLGKDDEEVEENKAEPVQEKEVKVEINKDVDPEITTAKALSVLLKSDNESITAAVKELSSHLDAAKPSQSRSTIDGKKHSVAQLNRVIRRLIRSK